VFVGRALLRYLKLPRVASHCLHKILIIIIKGMLVISRAYHYSPRPLPDPRPTPSSRLALALGIARRPDPARAVAFTKAATAAAAAAALARRRAGLPSPALTCSYPSDRCPALSLPLAAAGASSRPLALWVMLFSSCIVLLCSPLLDFVSFVHKRNCYGSLPLVPVLQPGNREGHPEPADSQCHW